MGGPSMSGETMTDATGAVPRIRCQGLTRRLASGGRELTILDTLDLEVRDGEFLALLGPSGSGKSTLLGLLAGLDRPSGGGVWIDGVPLEGKSEDELARLRRAKVGFVFQSYRLLPNLTAKENILLPLELVGSPDRDGRVDALLAEVGLEDRGHHYPGQLSGGEQQRVALARAFAAAPPILLADEPTGNLDGETGRRVLDVLDRMRAKEGTTLVLATHDPAVAERADRSIHLIDGRIDRIEVADSMASSPEVAAP